MNEGYNVKNRDGEQERKDFGGAKYWINMYEVVCKRKEKEN